MFKLLCIKKAVYIFHLVEFVKVVIVVVFVIVVVIVEKL